jgi:proline iminopeptidase
MRTLYPEIEPRRTGRLATDAPHELYFEECGNPEGVPVVYLHGGPGSGCRPRQRRYFDPARYRIVLFDQRGCGRSTPLGTLEGNDMAGQLRDLEALRASLGIERWLVFGGSWGSVLGLAYALAHPGAVAGLVMWGIFLGRRQEIDWVFGPDGAARLFPEAYAQFRDFLPPEARDDPLAGYAAAMESADGEQRRAALWHWTRWENKITDIAVTEANLDEQMKNPDYVLTHSLFEVHYFCNGCFVDGDDMLRRASVLASMPVHIVASRYDLVCPVETAWQLHRAIPGSTLTIAPHAGHAPGPETVDILVRTTDALARELRP